jgi:two pore calcium channel protein, plant
MNVFIYIQMHVVQKPLWCWNNDYSCKERDTFFLGELPYLEKKESLIYEVFFLFATF